MEYKRKVINCNIKDIKYNNNMIILTAFWKYKYLYVLFLYLHIYCNFENFDHILYFLNAIIKILYC